MRTCVMAQNEWLSEYKRHAELEFLDCPFEVWEIQGSNASMGYATHAIFRYFGKFPPPVARRFITDFHDPSIGPVIDTMAGSGTTLVEAAILGRKAIGFDINPLSVLISNVKINKVNRSVVEKHLDEYATYMKKGTRKRKAIAALIPADSYLDHWFFPKVQKELALTRMFIDTIADLEIKNLFIAALAASIRNCSRASRNMGRMFLDPAFEPVEVCPIVTKRVNKILKGLDELPENIDAKAIVHNSMEPLDQKLKTNLMICHPPYFNVYKYSSIFKFEMLWTGFSPKLIRPKELRESFKIGKEERVHLYVEDLVKAVINSANTVAIGGRFVLMMGDTTLREERINTTSLFIKALEASKSDFEIEEFIIRVPKHTEASYAAGQRRDGNQVGVKLRDHILILKRSRE